MQTTDDTGWGRENPAVGTDAQQMWGRLPHPPQQKKTGPLLSRPTPIQAAGQQPNFQIKADVRVREDSFACKEISDLDRLLQINQRGGFTSGTQLYVYLQRHNCIGLTEGRRACVREQGTICLHLRFEEQEQDYQALRLDEKGDAEMKTFR